MAAYSRREVYTRRVEYIVPAEWPEGACWSEIGKAFAAAIQELRETGRLGPDETPSDDAIRVRPGDEDVVIYFESTDAAMEAGQS